MLIDDREGLDSIVSSVFTHREKTYRTRTGEHVAVRFSNALLRDDNGQLSGIVCVASDIRRDKELERNLREAKELAEDATKAKSNFLANMSHSSKNTTAYDGKTYKILDLYRALDKAAVCLDSDYAETGDRSTCPEFPDVLPSHWGYEAVKTLACECVIEGYPDWTFRPESPH